MEHLLAALLATAAASPPATFRDLALERLRATPDVVEADLRSASLSITAGRARFRGVRLAGEGPGWRWDLRARDVEIRFLLPRLLLLGTIDTVAARGVVLEVERRPAPGDTASPWTLPWGWLRSVPGVRVARAAARCETIVVRDRVAGLEAEFRGVRATLADIFDTPAAFVRAGRLEATAEAWRLRDGAETDGGRIRATARFPSHGRPVLSAGLSTAALLGASAIDLEAVQGADGHVRLRPTGSGRSSRTRPRRATPRRRAPRRCRVHASGRRCSRA